jgi:hypothetical protein
MVKGEAMAKDLHFNRMPLAEEYDVGDDSDLPGYSQPLSLDDIDAVLNDPNGAVEDRRALLLRMLEDLRTREGMDQSEEYVALIARVQDALALLDQPGDGIGNPGSYAFDDADRAEQPDEMLERAEEEAKDAEERGVA